MMNKLYPSTGQYERKFFFNAVVACYCWLQFRPDSTKPALIDGNVISPITPPVPSPTAGGERIAMNIHCNLCGYIYCGRYK